VTTDRYVVSWPTLYVGPSWVEAHCVQPDGFRRGRAFRYYDWQLWCTLNHYRVKPTALWIPDNPLRAAAFHNRRSVVIGPQKTGKGPWSATGCALEGAGPALFAGWAGPDDGYVCADHGCGCGWEYPYEQGEPMGMRWPTPLIQITATSEAQTDNIYRPLQDMIRLGPLGDMMRVGEGFIRIGTTGRDRRRHSQCAVPPGQPDHLRGAGRDRDLRRLERHAQGRRDPAPRPGRHERPAQETTNPYDPSEDSVAQRTFESTAEDVFKFYEAPPANLSYRNKRERRKIHQFNYAGSPHVDVDAIDAEAAELAEKDPEQAERFYGNRMVYGAGTGSKATSGTPAPSRARCPAGTDRARLRRLGRRRLDRSAGCRPRTATSSRRSTASTRSRASGIRPSIAARSRASRSRRPSRRSVERFSVVRMYRIRRTGRPRSTPWPAKHGEKVVLRWETYRITQMHAALKRMHTDVTKDATTFTHDGDAVMAVHIRNARKLARAGQKYILGKPSQTQKIDGAMSAALCNEAAGDVTAAGLWARPAAEYAYSA
jgi:hypothetical protein